MTQGIIFDFNGVLLWDERLNEQAWQIVAQKLLSRTLTADEFIRQVHGQPSDQSLRALSKGALSDTAIAQAAKDKAALYRELCLAHPEEFVLSPGAKPLLDRLRAQRVPRTIATSSGRADLDFFVEHLGLHTWFDDSRIVYDDGSFPCKPAPDVYLRAAANIGLAPRDCVVVEDSVAGLAAARAAGIGRIIALGPRSRHARLAGYAGVAMVIESLAELSGERLPVRT